MAHSFHDATRCVEAFRHSVDEEGAVIYAEVIVGLQEAEAPT